MPRRICQAPARCKHLTAANFENPLIILIVSMVIGALAGYLSGQLAKVMTRKV
ncbi:MAG: hypothetical protein ACREXU_11075 [Gammaproteobacteria bacterium]